MRIIGLALLFIATPAAAADQFDLVCTANKSVTRYRVDLKTNEACSGKCDRVWKMGEPSSGELKLIEMNNSRDLEVMATVNRLTGAYSYHHRIRGGEAVYEMGLCSLAEFSGFPATKF